MAGDNLNVWYDPEGDHLEIVFDQKPGVFEETPAENVMRKLDADGNLLAVSISNLSSFARSRPSASGYQRWTVFNLDVDDGAIPFFDVAMGYELFHVGENAWDFAPADAREKCAVFFDRENSTPARRLGRIERTLEIWHEPTSSPVVSIGKNPWSPVSMTSLCRDQLALALRLFQPQRLLIFPWTWRDEGRRRAYTELAIQQGVPAAPYTLRGPLVGRFQEFASRLRKFHLDRNRYRCLRWDPVGSILASALDARGGAKFLARVSRLMLATDSFEEAQEGHAGADEIRLIQLVMAAEALFSTDDKSELSYRLAHRMAALNGAGMDDRKEHFELVRTMYAARSKLVHGAALVQKPPAHLREVVGGAGYIEIPPDHLLRFNNLVRASILYFIALQDSSEDVLKVLDRAVWDPAEVSVLRRQANEYWGLGGSEDELLCSRRWLV